MDGGRRRAVGWPEQESLRDGSWGSPADREFVSRLAADIAERAGFAVCVLEAVRVDSTVECVAVHGEAVGAVQHIGHVRPLTEAEAVDPGGATHGELIFLAAGGRARRAVRSERGARVPGPRSTGDEEVWRPGDRVVAHLHDDQKELRALVLLDQPLDGLRPRGDDLRDLSDALQLAFRSLVSGVERELLTQQVRLARAVRRVVRSAGNETNAQDLLDLVRWQMREGFRADELYINLLDSDTHPLPTTHIFSDQLFDSLVAASRRAWVRDDVIIIEAGHVWGDEALHRKHSAEIKHLFIKHGLGTMVLVPIGDNTLLLGALTVVRHLGQPRWTDSESRAALDVCRDLGHAILNARAFEREQALNAELTRREAHRTELIATVSHELNNPTGVILGHLEMLAGRTDLDPVVHRSLAAIGRSAERIAALSEDLLMLRVLEDPLHPLERRPVDLAQVVSEVVDLSQVIAAGGEVELEMNLPESVAIVIGDRIELTQAVTNLVSNAIKYTDPGGHVCLGVALSEDEVELTCTDDGIGISAQDLSRLFSEFFRSTNIDALQRPGHGLGLTILQRIVDRHDGTVEVKSRRDQGTTFRVILPRAEESE